MVITEANCFKRNRHLFQKARKKGNSLSHYDLGHFSFACFLIGFKDSIKI